ncbi:MAG: TonB-dependent receptor, partial [Muribaculaceae bacterium]|nr:TonB-dependent receptor [Muribaculaceae bacterium]
MKFKAILPALIAGVVMPLFCHAEEEVDSITHQLDELEVTASHRPLATSQELSGVELQKLSSTSIADALKYFAGVQIKDYGGLGGLKTVNVRSLG